MSKPLQADLHNPVIKTVAGKLMTAAERAHIESLSAGSNDSVIYAKTLMIGGADLTGHARDGMFPA